MSKRKHQEVEDEEEEAEEEEADEDDQDASDDDDDDDDMEVIGASSAGPTKSSTTSSLMTNRKSSSLKGDGTYFEKDILMGRGKRVSEWPGNLYFRQLVAQHRERYLHAPRHEKVAIAEQVISQIQAMGGRFLKEEDDDDDDDENASPKDDCWYEVDQERAVEKTCQALREKDKAKTPTGDPFANPDKKTSLSPFTTGKVKRSRNKKKRKLFGRAGSDESEDDDDDDDDDSDDDADSFKLDQDDAGPKKALATSETPTKDSTDKPKMTVNASNVIQQIRSYDEHEMLKRLNQFKTVYGHCGVPPGWPRDLRLADWCTAQRQVYREIMATKRNNNNNSFRGMVNGGGDGNEEMEDRQDKAASGDCYRTPSKAEDELMKELEDMEFVWNYEDWHWKDRYDQLMAVEHGDLEPENAVFTRKVLVRWLSHEREHVRLGETVLTNEQMEDLKRAGIVL